MGSGSSKKTTTQNEGNVKKESRDAGQSKISTDPGFQKHKGELRTPETRDMQSKDENKMEAMLRKVDEKKMILQEGKEQKPTESIPYKAFCGNFDVECPSSTKIVRIFTSSTFTDTENERNHLMQHAYPELKSFCQRHGYEFQVVDMRWGIRDEAKDDHMVTEICLKELRLCQKLSTGPNFVTLLSHKYGYNAFPRTIQAEEFDKIMSKIECEEDLLLFKKWYHRDDNALIPEYVLDPISVHLGNFNSKDETLQKEANTKWNNERERMLRVLGEISKKIFEETTARKYVMSVTEVEITKGLITIEKGDKHCIWVKRTIKDIEKQEYSDELSRYTECAKEEKDNEMVKRAQNLLRTLKEEKMDKSLPKDRILSYTIDWTEKGLTKEKKEHSEYLKKMNDDFVAKMKEMINTAVNERAQKEDPLIEEVYRHVRVCQTKTDAFHGQEESIKTIKKYIDSTGTLPLVIYGESGCGKTSIMAKGAQVAYDHLKGNAVVVLRFLGTTPESTSVKTLLKSVTTQIKIVYGVSSPVPESFDDLVNDFHETLKFATASKPLIILFDSLDQLDTGNNAHQLAWLPEKLPNHVKLIVSTLPEESHECLPVLRTRMSDTTKLHKVPALSDNDVIGIIDKWLSVNKRTLTKEQLIFLKEAFLKCPLALFLKLSFDEALRWKSFTMKEELVLQSSIRESINALFQRLEVLHGKIFVSKSLGYLTVARMGVTESELEDILSCDDDVLNDVYQYWTPPVRRLPPLLLVRLKTDLEQYLVDREADGARVLFWYHRQFTEAAHDRYASDKQIHRQLHAALADFFAGTWANGKKKPFKIKDNKTLEEDRYVRQQPLTFEKDNEGNTSEKDKRVSHQQLKCTNFNLRKLNNLPYHRIKAEQSDLLKEESLANFDFLLSKLQATGFWDLNDDFLLAKTLLPRDETIEVIHDTLQISQKALIYDPCQLASQMLCRIEKNSTTKEFLRQCEACRYPYLISDKKVLLGPGGQLVLSLTAHKGDIHSVDTTADGKLVVTAGDDESICLWDTVHRRYIRKIKCKSVVSARFCCGDKYLVCEEEKSFTVREAQRGLKQGSIHHGGRNPWVLVGDHKGQLVSFVENTVSIYDLKDCSTIKTIQSQDKFDNLAPVTGSVHYAVCACGDGYTFHSFAVLDVRTTQFVYTQRAFPVSDDDDDDDNDGEIESIVITPDENCLIFSVVFENDIHIMEVKSRETIKVIKGSVEDHLQDLKVTLDGKFLFCFDTSVLKIYDLITHKQTKCLEHYVPIKAICSPDLKTVVTIADDGNLRVWDRNRTDQETQTKPRAMADNKTADNATLLQNVTSLLPMPNSRYILGSATRNDNGNKFFIFIYDIIKKEIAREACTETNVYLALLGEKHALMKVEVDQHKVEGPAELCDAYVIELESMKPIVKLVGKVHSSSKLLVFNNDTEAVTLTKGRKHVKIYDVLSGKVSDVIKTKQTERIDALEMNSQGFILVARCKSLMLVFNLEKREILHQIDLKMLDIKGTRAITLITPDDSCILYDILILPKEAPDDNSSSVRCLASWDVKNSNKKQLFDIEYYKKYMSTHNREGLLNSLDIAELLDNDTVIVADDDFIMRRYNIKTGELLQRFEGMHTTGLEMHITTQMKRFVTYGCWSEENTFRLWDKGDLSCLASFTLDQAVTKLLMTKDGRYIVAHSKCAFGIVTWSLFNGDDQGTPSYPEEFPKKKSTELKLSVFDDASEPDTKSEDENDDAWNGDK